jgi:hypothetical protein
MIYFHRHVIGWARGVHLVGLGHGMGLNVKIVDLKGRNKNG